MLDLKPVLAAIRSGLVIGLPTDTVYGIGADPFSEAAMQRLFTAKGRPPDNPIPVLAASVDGLAAVALVDRQVREVGARHWPGALTIVVRRHPGAPAWIGSPKGTVGVRVPNHPIALEVLAASGPLAVTSANRSGDPPAADAVEAEAVLGDAVARYVPGTGGGGAPSTVVDLSGSAPSVLRRGPVDWAGAGV